MTEVKEKKLFIQAKRTPNCNSQYLTAPSARFSRPQWAPSSWPCPLAMKWGSTEQPLCPGHAPSHLLQKVNPVLARTSTRADLAQPFARCQQPDSKILSGSKIQSSLSKFDSFGLCIYCQCWNFHWVNAKEHLMRANNCLIKTNAFLLLQDRVPLWTRALPCLLPVSVFKQPRLFQQLGSKWLKYHCMILWGILSNEYSN